MQAIRGSAMMVIYFIQIGEDGPVKIGLTTNVLHRLSGLQTSSPFTLNILAMEKGSLWREKQLHSQFKKAHIRGEWFDYSNPELCAYIAALPPYEGITVAFDFSDEQDALMCKASDVTGEELTSLIRKWCILGAKQDIAEREKK